jgi:hypothetical protein
LLHRNVPAYSKPPWRDWTRKHAAQGPADQKPQRKDAELLPSPHFKGFSRAACVALHRRETPGSLR